MLVRNTDLVKVVEDVNMKLPEIIYYDTNKEVTVTIDEDGHHGFFLRCAGGISAPIVLDVRQYAGRENTGI